MNAYRAYIITNTVTSKQYVGITTKSLIRRWYAHVVDSNRPSQQTRALQRAIRKYGRDAFIIEHVASAKTWDDLCDVEAALISQRATFAPLGYNLTCGGEGVVGRILSAETRAKIGAGNRGKKRSAAGIEAMRTRLLGKKQSLETIAKRAAKQNGRKLPSPTLEVREKIAAALRGRPAKPLSKEQRAALGAINRILNTGKKHSAETCAKRSESMKKVWETRVVSEEWRLQTIARNKAKTGTKASAETRARMKASHKKLWAERKTVAR